MNVINKNAFILSLILLLPACSTVSKQSKVINKEGNEVITQTNETSIDSQFFAVILNAIMIYSKPSIALSMRPVAGVEEVKPVLDERNNDEQNFECKMNTQKVGRLFKNC